MTPKSRGTSQDATPETDVVEILDDELAGAITEVDDPKATPDDAVSMTKPAAKAAAEVAVPEAKVPDVKVPQVAAPDVKAPDVKVPDVEHTQPVQKVEDTIVDTPAQAPVVIPPAAPPVAKAGAKGGLVGKVSGVTGGLKEKVTPVVKPGNIYSCCLRFDIVFAQPPQGPVAFGAHRPMVGAQDQFRALGGPGHRDARGNHDDLWLAEHHRRLRRPQCSRWAHLGRKLRLLHPRLRWSRPSARPHRPHRSGQYVLAA
ncbi:MAG: hypothetical protein V9E81_16845 [Marmoricola sp.]